MQTPLPKYIIQIALPTTNSRARSTQDTSQLRPLSSTLPAPRRFVFSLRNPAHAVMATPITNSTAKAVAAERSAHALNATTNLMRLLRESTHSEIVAQLPKDLAAKVPTIRSTGKLLEKMPAVIVALDAHLDNAKRSASQLTEIKDLLASREVPRSEEQNSSSPTAGA